MPAPLCLQLSDAQLDELRLARRAAHGRVPERAKYVLMNAVDGLTTYTIAKQEQRDVRTIRHWLMAYKTNGLDGLREQYNGGRLRTNRNKVIELLRSLLSQKPQESGFKTELWTSTLLTKACKRDLEFSVSGRTVRRALKDMGWSYKRTRLDVPEHAPTAEEKKAPLSA